MGVSGQLHELAAFPLILLIKFPLILQLDQCHDAIRDFQITSTTIKCK